MAAEGAGRRAGRIEQDRVERLVRRPSRARRRRPFPPQARCAADCRQVGPDDFPSGRARSPHGRRRRAAWSCRPARRRRRGRACADAGISRAGSEAARSCTHQRPSPKPGKSVTAPCVIEAAVARSERHAFGKVGAGRVVGEAEVERRAVGDGAAGGLDDLLAPGRAPALLDRLGQARRVDWRDALAQQGAEHAMDQPPRPAVDQRQAVATSAWSGVPRPIFCASARRSTIRALLSSGKRCRVAPSISASRSGRRRSVSPAMALASAASAGRSGAGGIVHRLAAQHASRSERARVQPPSLSWPLGIIGA